MRLVPVILCLAAPLRADPFTLNLPIACTLGENCYLQQFVDHDASDGAADFRCGPQTYDGHHGTDFALDSLQTMAAGVDVLAAADGVVLAIRDGMADVSQSAENAPDVNNRECGNGAVIEHMMGYTTQYCHLAEGSLTVAAGTAVESGATLGRVGLSGQTQFPHLHFSVRLNGEEVDPFDPDGEITCGAPSDETLWSTPLSAPLGGLISSGFSDDVPNYDAVLAGLDPIASLPADTAGLVVWGFLFGGRADDTLEITITGPAGEVIAHRETLDRTQARVFRAAGRRTPAEGWPTGDYSAEVRMLRGGEPLDVHSLALTISD